MRTFSSQRAVMLVARAAVLCAVTATATIADGPPEPAPQDGPAGMVWIPGGEFTMGTDDERSLLNERPAHRVQVSGFWMDARAVTNAQFREFVDATKYITTAERPVDWEELKKQVPPGTPKPPDEMLQPGSLVYTPPGRRVALDDMSAWWSWTTGASWRHPQGPSSTIEGKDDYPVLQVSWDDACAYAAWAGKRLPTEAEWEYAARGGLEGKRFVWGDEFRPGGRHLCNTYTGTFPVEDTAADGFAGPAPVGSYPPNGYGLYDMAGNVWQWCSDWYADDANERAAAQKSCCDPAGPAATFSARNPHAIERVTKGGSFLCSDQYCESYRPSARRGTPPDTGTGHIGFRCVKPGPSAAAAPR